MRGNSRIEGTRPVRSGLRPPPSSPANLVREETRAGFPYSFRGFAGVGAPPDARGVRIAPHYRSRSRLSISGGSVCADGFPVGVPFTLRWPPMARVARPPALGDGTAWQLHRRRARVLVHRCRIHRQHDRARRRIVLGDRHRQLIAYYPSFGRAAPLRREGRSIRRLRVLDSRLQRFREPLAFSKLARGSLERTGHPSVPQSSSAVPPLKGERTPEVA